MSRAPELLSPQSRGVTASGFSLLELVVALAIGAVLATILSSTLLSTQRLARLHGSRVAIAETRRVTDAILSAELRYLEPASDLYELGPDSVVLRNYRGAATVCAIDGEQVTVRYRGIRGPDPEKDSVIIVNATDPDGSLTGPIPLQLSSPMSDADHCRRMAEEEVTFYRWRIEPQPEPGTLLLLMESGSYHLTGNAFRYRRGESGRQPLTAEHLDDSITRLTWRGGAVELSLGTRSPASDIHSSAEKSTSPVSYRLGLLNGSRL